MEEIEDNRDEDHVGELVRYAFRKIDLELTSSYPIMYDEKSRRVEVKIETALDGIALSKLMRLNDTGLSDHYGIEGGRDGELIIHFVISVELLSAEIPN